MQYDERTIDIPTWDGVPRNVAELWRLQKGTKVAVCSLWTHPEGAQLRLVIDGKLRESDASHQTWALPIVALGWKDRMQWLQGLALTSVAHASSC
jgi:hypothetical protein